MKASLRLGDTASAIGLRYLLDTYFDILATVGACPDSDADPSTLYIVSPEELASRLDFYIPRRQRTIVAGPGSTMLDTAADESAIVERLQELLHTCEPAVTTSGADLSPREIEVLKLVVAGYINKEIAEHLNISFHTVLSHRKNISAKLGIKSVSGLSVYAMMNGYL